MKIANLYMDLFILRGNKMNTRVLFLLHNVIFVIIIVILLWDNAYYESVKIYCTRSMHYSIYLSRGNYLFFLVTSHLFTIWIPSLIIVYGKFLCFRAINNIALTRLYFFLCFFCLLVAWSYSGILAQG